MSKKLIYIVICMLIFTSCISKEETEQQSILQDEDELQSVNAKKYNVLTDNSEEYDFFIKNKNYKYALFEPEKGCYLGAYILSNKKVNFDIDEYESVIEASHSIYKYNLNVSDEFPQNWILSCISKLKTPYIVLNIDDFENSFDENKINELSKKFDEYYVPIFVQFSSPNKTISSKKYKECFIKVHDIFKENASNVAFVWSVNMEDAYNCNEYYPGDDYVDWVGINVIETIDSEKLYKDDIFKAIDYFYYTFQMKKPIIISSLAISHLSSSNFIYQTSPAALEIERVYNNINNNHPRIKGVIYLDFNGMDIEDEKKIKDDFSITGEKRLMETYKKSVSQERFLSELTITSKNDLQIETFKSPLKIHKVSDNYYISKNSVENELNIRGISSYGEALIINGENYFNINILEEKNIGILEIDNINKKAIFTIN